MHIKISAVLGKVTNFFQHFKNDYCNFRKPTQYLYLEMQAYYYFLLS